jgi:hypothetical protein
MEECKRKGKKRSIIYLYEHINDLQYNNTKNMALDVKNSSITIQCCMCIAFYMNIYNDPWHLFYS